MSGSESDSDVDFAHFGRSSIQAREMNKQGKEELWVDEYSYCRGKLYSAAMGAGIVSW